MAIKKDATGKRWVEMELLLPATPEQVWHALATGEGNAGWFVKGEIEPRVGGLFRLDFGQGVITSGQVTQWEPPHQFAYVEREWEAGAPPVATEITITSRSGDRCLVRMVHSMFTSSDDWDDQIEGFEQGWPGFFAVLRAYLTHFAGAPAASFLASTTATEKSLPAWQRLCEKLGVAGANVGERRSAVAAPEAWSGSLEHTHQDSQQRYVMLILDQPTPGIALAGTHDKGTSTNVSVCRYFYGSDAERLATELEPRWRQWLSDNFSAKAPEGS